MFANRAKVFSQISTNRWGDAAPFWRRAMLKTLIASWNFTDSKGGMGIANSPLSDFTRLIVSNRKSGGASAFDGLASSERTAIRSAPPDQNIEAGITKSLRTGPLDSRKE